MSDKNVESSESEGSVSDEEVVPTAPSGSDEVVPTVPKKNEEVVPTAPSGSDEVVPTVSKKEKKKFGCKIPVSFQYDLSEAEKATLNNYTEKQKNDHLTMLGKMMSEFKFYSSEKKTPDLKDGNTLSFYVKVKNGNKTVQVDVDDMKTKVSAIRDAGAQKLGYKTRKEITGFSAVEYNGEEVSTMSSLNGKAFKGKNIKSGDVFTLVP